MQNERSILTKTVIYFSGCILSIIALLTLNYFLGTNILDPHIFPGFIKYALLPLIISIIIGYIISLAASFSQARFVVFSIITTAIIILGLIGFYFGSTCQELECIFAAFFYVALLIAIIPYSASIPIYFPEIPIVIFPIIVIIATSLIWVSVSFKNISARIAQKAEVKKEQTILKESGLSIYETNYQQFATKELFLDRTVDNRNKNLEPTKSVTHDDFNWLTYEGYWLDNQREYRVEQDKYQLNIRELKPAKNFSDEELYSRDYAELQKYKEFEASLYKIQLEGIKINNYPAIYISNGFRDQKLRIYRQGVIIEIRVDSIGQGTFPKDELLKVGESLQVINKP